jgi:hypothetical protein
MKPNMTVQLIGALIIHAITVAILGLIGIFFWNVGICGISDTINPISFLTSTAIMTGIYVVNMFVSAWHKKLQRNKVNNFLKELKKK